MGKKRRTRRGKPRAIIRSSKRREHANRVNTQWHVVEIKLGSLVNGGRNRRMTAAIDLYRERIPVLCERLKVASESWLQALWKRIKRQYNTIILSVIAAQWQQMTRHQHIAMYQVVSTRTAACYAGTDEFRICTDRCKEHLTQIRDSELQSDPKYAFMSQFGSNLGAQDRGSSFNTSSPCPYEECDAVNT